MKEESKEVTYNKENDLDHYFKVIAIYSNGITYFSTYLYKNMLESYDVRL